MKKLNVLFIAIFAVTAAFMTSCKSNTDDVAPTISGLSVVTPAAEITPGSTVRFKMTLSTQNKGITALAVVGTGLDGAAVITAEVPANYVDGKFKDKLTSAVVFADVKVGANQSAGTKIAVSFTVTDDKLTSTEASTITVVAAGGTGTLKTNTITLGAQNNTAAGFAASFEGTVFKAVEAPAQSTIIDVVYYNGNTNAESLMSPSFANANNLTTTIWANWSVKNATKFVKITAAEYDAATYASVAATTPTLELANHLAVGDVYAFSTINSKKGVFKVTALTAGDNGTATFEIKIQNAAGTK